MGGIRSMRMFWGWVISCCRFMKYYKCSLSAMVSKMKLPTIVLSIVNVSISISDFIAVYETIQSLLVVIVEVIGVCCMACWVVLVVIVEIIGVCCMACWVV